MPAAGLRVLSQAAQTAELWYTYRMAKKRTDLKIPYGVSDFRTIRNEGLYYVDKTEYLAQMEAREWGTA